MSQEIADGELSHPQNFATVVLCVHADESKGSVSFLEAKPYSSSI